VKQVVNDLQVKNQEAGSSQYMLGNPAAAEKAIRGLTLRVNRFASPNICNFSRYPPRCREKLADQKTRYFHCS